MKHPANDWNFDDTIEEGFQEWFNENYGEYSYRSEWFWGDCETKDEKTLKNAMYVWIHAAFCAGAEYGIMKTKDNTIEKNYEEINQRIKETKELIEKIDEYLEK